MSDTRRNSGSGTRDSGEHTPIDLDAAIDVVAREMTRMEPSAALRARVLERIEQETRRPGPVLPRWAWAGGAAVMLVAVATGLWLTRPMPGPRGSEGTVAQQRAAAPIVPDRSVPRPSVQTGSEPGANTGSRPAGLLERSPSAPRMPLSGAQSIADAAAGPLMEDAALVPPLADIEPLGFSTVEPAPLHVRIVDVAPLDLVPTIDIPSLHPGPTDPQSADPKKEK